MRLTASGGTSLFYNLRFRAILYQVVAVGCILLVSFYLFSNVSQKLPNRTLPRGLDPGS